MNSDFNKIQGKAFRAGSFSRRLLGTTLLAGVVASGAVLAGEYTPIGKTGGQYSFTECEKPVAPALALDPKKRGNSAVRDYNDQVKLYNGYLGEVQTYMNCLTHEADRDLETFYKAVNASLEEQQVRMQDESDGLKKVLAGGPNNNRKKLVPVDVPELDGADPVAVDSVPSSENSVSITPDSLEDTTEQVGEISDETASDIVEDIVTDPASELKEEASREIELPKAATSVVETPVIDVPVVDVPADVGEAVKLDEALLNQPGVTFGVPAETSESPSEQASEEASEQN